MENKKLLGLASSLPFLIITRQHNRYIFQSYPFYVLSLAFAADRVAAGIESILSRRPRLRIATGAIAMIFFPVAFASMLTGKDSGCSVPAGYQRTTARRPTHTFFTCKGDPSLF